jgi:1-acyl-sn-glycerol-3-phosphate acyltransferase
MSADVELKRQVYGDPRPAEHFAPFHERVREREPEAKVYEVTRVLTVLNALITYRARALGSENVPTGPVILAPNHASFMDHFFVAGFIRRRVQFMAKSQLFKGAGEWIFSHGGVFPVRRGHQDEEAFTTAFTILARGGAVVMYCEGGRSRTGAVGSKARRGIGRLALESGAPVVPIAILGSHQVRNWRRLQFPRIRIHYGVPFRFARIEVPTREQQQHAADLILERIRALHTELAASTGAGRSAPTPSPRPRPLPGRAPAPPARAS